jgi:antitoxin component of MazEF toxin-antitoxin module
MIRKVFKTGHSAAVTLSKSLLKDMGLKIGDSVKVELDEKKEQISVRHAGKQNQLSLGFKVRAKL